MNAAGKNLSKPEYDVAVETNVRIPLRDGIRLATDIYVPAQGGRRTGGAFPVLLLRTPYGKGNHKTRAAFFAERGYGFAVQDVRGRNDSEGVFYPFRDEAPDGYDTVEWLAAQPWCNGKVGALGESYEAAVQSALACLNPPHLAAMVPTYGPWSYYHHALRQNGALELRFIAYAFLMGANSREALADERVRKALEEAHGNVWDWLARFPLRRDGSPLRHVPALEQWALDISTHARYDDYWRAMGYGPRPYVEQHADVPVLFIGGWYDSYPRAAVEAFTALRQRKKSAMRLVLGPWQHGNRGRDAEVGDAFFPHDPTRLDFLDMHLAWFDQWLKGRDLGLAEEPAVELFVMGGGPGAVGPDKRILPGGEWRSCATWPPPGHHATRFFFHGDGRLQTTPPAEPEDSTVYLFDPSDPVPTIGGCLSSIPIPPGMFDQRNDPRFPTARGTLPLSARADVLCFQTPPLERVVEIAGPIEVHLWVSTDGPDTDFTAKLIDVHPPSAATPDGCAANLGDSIGRLRFRNGFDAEELAEPGRVYELSFELYPTANRFEPGHRIRVDISSSNYPRFDVNPNTGGPLGIERRRRIAENRLFHDAARPSCIVLPLQP